MTEVLVGVLIGGSWVYNLYCWVRGFKLSAYAVADNSLIKAFNHLAYTMADIACVGLVRFLIGDYASSMVPAAVIAILVSWQINRIRNGKSTLLKRESNYQL